MRKKKRSLFKMYMATTLLAFLIPTIFSATLVLKNKQKYLDNIVSYINRVSPINISISDISVSYKLEIILEDVKLYSKKDFQIQKNSVKYGYETINQSSFFWIY